MKRAEEVGYVEFMLAHSHSLFRTAFLLTGDYQQAEDLVQTTMAKVYLSWSRISVMGQPGAYARRILVNQATSWWRRKSSSEVPLLTLDDKTASGFEDEVAESSTVWDAVLTLAPRQRAVIVLRYYEDLTEAETADVLGISVGTVKSHTHAARQRLASLLTDSHVLETGGK